MAQTQSEIRYLTPLSVDVKKKKYCRFKRSGIKYIEYKDPEFLKKFLNEQGKILPRRITGIEVSKKSGTSRKTCASSCPSSFCNRLDEIIFKDYDYENHIKRRRKQPRL